MTNRTVEAFVANTKKWKNSIDLSGLNPLRLKLDLGNIPPFWTKRQYSRFERYRLIGLVVIWLQFVFYCIWSFWEYTHFELTWDFSSYYQAYYLIGRGDLDPWSSTLRMPFWQNHSEAIMYVLGLVSVFFPSGYALLVLQDLGTTFTTVVAFNWICEYLKKRQPTKLVSPAYLILLGGLILVFDPWPLWSLAFDYHAETLAGLTVLLAARAFWREDKKMGLFWSFATMLTGDVGCTYLAGIGISLVLVNIRHAFSSKKSRRDILWALGLLLFASIYLSVLHAIGGDQGGGLASYGYLVYPVDKVPANFNLVDLILGTLKHPGNYISVLWQRRANLYANVAALGLIGFFTPWGFGVPLILQLENGLHSYEFFSVPGFQSEPIYGFVGFGTIVALYNIARFCERFYAKLTTGAHKFLRKFSRALPKNLGYLLGAYTFLWAVLWYPAAPSHWLRVPTSSAQVLDQVYNLVKPDDEAFVTQGVTGRFAQRQYLFPIMGAGDYGYPLLRRKTAWWVITPFDGTEISYTAVDLNMISALVEQLHGQVVIHKNNVWAIKTYFSKNSPTTAYFPLTPESVASWTPRTTVGWRVLKGPESLWHMQASSPPNHPVSGYVVWGDYWQFLPGNFQASVTLSSDVSKGVHFEVWDADSNVLLLKRTIPPTVGIKTFKYNFRLTSNEEVPETAYSGFGIFSTYPIPPPVGNRLEIRVWTPGGGSLSVYKQGMIQLS